MNTTLFDMPKKERKAPVREYSEKTLSSWDYKEEFLIALMNAKNELGLDNLEAVKSGRYYAVDCETILEYEHIKNAFYSYDMLTSILDKHFSKFFTLKISKDPYDWNYYIFDLKD
jgi:hypothetical protein